MNTSELIAIHCDGKNQRLAFRYREPKARWDMYQEVVPLWDIPDALQLCMEKIEAHQPGVLAMACLIDERNYERSRRRRRRYIAKEGEQLYPASPHLIGYSVSVCGYWAVTNVSWLGAITVIRLLCQAGNIKFCASYEEFRSKAVRQKVGGSSSGINGVPAPARPIAGIWP